MPLLPSPPLSPPPPSSAALLRRRALLLAPWAGSASAEAAAIEAIYPRMPERPTDAYPYRLLQAALQASGQRFKLSLSVDALSSVRAFRNLKAGDFNVMDAGAAPNLASQAHMLPFPLDLGLSGYRLVLTRRDRVEALRAVQTQDDLRRLVFGQGPDWVDSRILRNAGMKVEEAQFLALFRMLEARRFDVFPLGVDEAATLLQRYQSLAPSAVVFDGWCLHYQFARVFVVAPGQPALAEALHLGLERIYANGTARAIVAQDPQIGPVLSGKHPLPKRVFELANPEWTAPYQAIPESLFYKPR